MKRTFGLTVFFAVAAHAQWLKYPTPGRAANTGRQTQPLRARAENRRWQARFLRRLADAPGYTGNIAKDLKPGEVSFQPWAEALYKHRVETEGKEDPQAYCVLSGVPREHVVPYPFKILNRQRRDRDSLRSAAQLPADLHGRTRASERSRIPRGWVIRSANGKATRWWWNRTGFVENNWLDNSGHPGTEALRLTERFHRRDFGHIDLEITIDDPKAYTKPWTVNLQFTANPDTDLIEYVCDENEKDLKHLVGK